MRYYGLCLLLVLLCSGCGPKTSTVEDLNTRIVTLPNGRKIRAEVMINQADLMRGMMFRKSAPRGTGMLFIHSAPNKYKYWMYQVLIPLDIIWMDSDHRIVEISANTPPCHTQASECPQYGGNMVAQYVLELAGGEAQRLNLRIGDTLTF